MSLENIALISFGHFEEDFLEKIGEGVTQEFLFPVKIIDPCILPIQPERRYFILINLFNVRALWEKYYFF